MQLTELFSQMSNLVWQRYKDFFMQLSEKCRKVFQDAIERYIAEQNQSLRTTEKACTPETSKQITLSTNS